MVEELIGYLPNVLKVTLPIIVGIFSISFYLKGRKTGFALIGIAFFLLSIPNIIQIALGGPYLAERLINQGYTISQIAVYQFYIFAMSAIFGIVFTVLAIVGLYFLHGSHL